MLRIFFQFGAPVTMILYRKSTNVDPWMKALIIDLMTVADCGFGVSCIGHPCAMMENGNFLQCNLDWDPLIFDIYMYS